MHTGGLITSSKPMALHNDTVISRKLYDRFPRFEDIDFSKPISIKVDIEPCDVKLLIANMKAMNRIIG